MEPLQAKLAKNGRDKSNLRDKSASRITFNQNFTMNLPITALKNVDDSLMQPSKATNFSTNVSQEGNSHRLPRIAGQAKISHMRVNSLGTNSALARPKRASTSYNSSPFRSTR